MHTVFQAAAEAYVLATVAAGGDGAYVDALARAAHEHGLDAEAMMWLTSFLEAKIDALVQTKEESEKIMI